MKSFKQYIVEKGPTPGFVPYDPDPMDGPPYGLPIPLPNQSPAPWYQDIIDDWILNPTNWPEGFPGWENIYPDGYPIDVEYAPYKPPPLWGGRNPAPWMNPFNPTEIDTGWGYGDPTGLGRPYGLNDFWYHGPVHMPDPNKPFHPHGPRDPNRGPWDAPIDPFDIIDDVMN